MQKGIVSFKHFIFRRPVLISIIVLIATFLCIYFYAFDHKIFLAGDNAEYYITGCALAEGKGYTNIQLPENPPANHFSPGYPFIISIAIRIFGENMFAVQLVNGMFFIAAVILLYLITRVITNNNMLAFIVSLLALLNAHLLFYSYITMSEIPFTFFYLLSIWLFIKSFSTGGALRQSYLWLFALSVVIAFYIKTPAIVILCAAMIILLVNKRWRQAILLSIIFLAAYVPWQLRTSRLGGNEYAKQVQLVNPYNAAEGKMKPADYYNRFQENTVRYLSREIPSAVSGNTIKDYHSEIDWKNYSAGAFLVLLVIAGIFSLPRFKWFFLLSTGGFFFILVLWPSAWKGVRFMMPLIPVLTFLIVKGALFMLEKALSVFFSWKKHMHYALFLFLPVIPYSAGQIKILHANAQAPYVSNYDFYLKLATWCKNNLPADAVIACRKPGLFYLFAHRKVTCYSFTKDGKQLIGDLKKGGVTHVVLDDLGFPSTSLYLWPAMMNNQDEFESVKGMGNNFLAKVRR